MDKIFPYLHWLLFLYAGWSLFEAYEEHGTNLEMKINELSSVETTFKSRNRKVMETQDFKKRKEESQQDLEKVEAELKKIKSKLISDGEQTQVLQDLSTDGETLNMQNLNFSPRQQITKGLYFVNGFDIKGSGTYLQLLIFLERLSFANRIYNIDQLSIKGKEQAKSGRLNFVDFNMTIEAYQYNENFVPPKTADEKPKQVPKQRGKK